MPFALYAVHGIYRSSSHPTSPSAVGSRPPEQGSLVRRFPSWTASCTRALWFVLYAAHSPFPFFSFAAALVGRNFMEVSRSRIEGLLAAFPKLIDSEGQHTFVETDTVR